MCLNLCIIGVRFYTFAYVTVFALNIKFTGKKTFLAKLSSAAGDTAVVLMIHIGTKKSSRIFIISTFTLSACFCIV